MRGQDTRGLLHLVEVRVKTEKSYGLFSHLLPTPPSVMEFMVHGHNLKENKFVA